MRKRLPPVALLLLAAGLAGVMTVDKPPLALWIQVASVEVFGFHPLAMLIPQALMGVAAAGLTYDLVRRRAHRRLAALLIDAYAAHFTISIDLI